MRYEVLEILLITVLVICGVLLFSLHDVLEIRILGRLSLKVAYLLQFIIY